MKILNKENNQLVIYIQQKNIKAILKYENKVPKSIRELANKLNFSNEDKFTGEEFIRITDKDSINYLEDIKWIADYRTLRDLTDLELANKTSEALLEIKNLQGLYEITYNDEQKHIQFTHEFAKKKLKLEDINAYIFTRQGTYAKPINIPLAIDGFSAILSSSGDLKFGQSLDHTKMLIERKNGKLFEQGYKVDPFEVQTGLTIIITESNLQPTVPGQFDMHIHKEPTHKYLVVDYKFEIDKSYVPPIEEPNKEKPTRLEQKQMKKSFFQRAFKPK